jgi:hypothetical protein
MDQCERVASTLRLRQATPVAVAPTPGYPARSGDSCRGSHQPAPPTEGPETRQDAGESGSCCDRLSVAYDRARRAAARVTPPSDSAEAHAAIERALAEAGGAYRTMARAALAIDGGKWDSARRAAVSREKALQSGLESLRSVG